MGVLDKFLNVMKLNDDYDDDDYLDDEIDDEFEEERPAKKHFFKKNDSFDEDDDFQDDFKIKEARKTKAPAPKVPASERPRQIKTQPVTSSKVSPIRPRKSSGMEVCVIKPKSMEDAREITETLLGGCTVVLNMEGLDLDKATLESILEVDNDVWAEEAKGIEEFYGKFGDKLPQELRDQLNALKDRLAK